VFSTTIFVPDKGFPDVLFTMVPEILNWAYPVVENAKCKMQKAKIKRRKANSEQRKSNFFICTIRLIFKSQTNFKSINRGKNELV
jgi:hypothetical protein